MNRTQAWCGLRYRHKVVTERVVHENYGQGVYFHMKVYTCVWCGKELAGDSSFGGPGGFYDHIRGFRPREVRR